MRKNFSSLLLAGGVSMWMSMSLSACSMKNVRDEKSAEAVKNENPSPRAMAPISPILVTPAGENLSGTSAHAPDESSASHGSGHGHGAHDAAPADHSTQAPKTAAHHEEKKGVDPEKALGWLKNGNIRFMKSSLRKDGQSKADVKRLSTGQTPHTIVLSCSDSRVPPEIVFDEKLGELFVVRNAGEIPDQASIASIEYAVEHLGARLIVVMGHSSCGAVKAAIGTISGGDAGSPALNNLVHDIHPRIASFKGRKPSSGVEDESWANARGVAKDLLARSAILSAKVASGEIMIKSALYHLDNGKVDFDQ